MGTGRDEEGARGRAGEGEKPRLHSNRYSPRNGVLSASLLRVAINNSIFSFTHMNAAGRGSGRAQPPSVWGGGRGRGRQGWIIGSSVCLRWMSVARWPGDDEVGTGRRRGMLGAPSCPQSTARFGPVPCAEPLGRRAGDKLCGDKLWHSHISLSAGDMDVGAGRGLEEHSLPCSALCLWGFPLGSCFKAPDWGDTEGAAPKIRPFGWRPPRPCHGHSSPHPTLPGWGVQPRTLLQAHCNSPVEGEPASSSLLQPRDTDRICGVQLLGFVVLLPHCLAMLGSWEGKQSPGKKRIEPQLCLSCAQPSGSKVPTSPAALGPIWRHHLGLQPTEQDLGCRKKQGAREEPEPRRRCLPPAPSGSPWEWRAAFAGCVCRAGERTQLTRRCC